jgi:small conductance mechanosensitive channel
MIDILKGILNILTKKEVYGVIVTIAISYFLYRTATIVLNEIMNYGKNHYERKKRKTVTNLFQNIIKYIILIFAVLAIFSIYGINIGGIVASLGIAATVIGLALQDTFKDIINGISIITENYFIVGDIVQYKTFTGEVIEFGLKSTKIKSTSGEVMVIANRNILELVNLSQKEQVVSIDIAIANTVDSKQVEKVIEKKILPRFETIKFVNKNSIEYLGVNEIASTHIKYLVRFSCEREKNLQAKRDANKIILEELTAADISPKY